MKHRVSKRSLTCQSLTHVPIRTIIVGPSSYHTEKVVLKNKQPPAYSFGIKSKLVISNDTPCKCNFSFSLVACSVDIIYVFMYLCY